ncbi:hypothetical protein JXC34_00405, partial [Candidatus Woesearchaeota archaeon]|nr:hypothetical protein [Candidatus Woesearchaeota archaeon]
MTTLTVFSSILSENQNDFFDLNLPSLDDLSQVPVFERNLREQKNIPTILDGLAHVELGLNYDEDNCRIYTLHCVYVPLIRN